MSAFGEVLDHLFPTGWFERLVRRLVILLLLTFLAGVGVAFLIYLFGVSRG